MTPAKHIHIPDLPSRPVCMQREDGQKIWMIAIDSFLSSADTYGRHPAIPSALCEGCGGSEDRGALRLVFVEVESEHTPTIKRGGLRLQLGSVCALGAVGAGTLALFEHTAMMRHYNN